MVGLTLQVPPAPTTVVRVCPPTTTVMVAPASALEPLMTGFESLMVLLLLMVPVMPGTLSVSTMLPAVGAAVSSVTFTIVLGP